MYKQVAQFFSVALVWYSTILVQHKNLCNVFIGLLLFSFGTSRGRNGFKAKKASDRIDISLFHLIFISLKNPYRCRFDKPVFNGQPVLSGQ